MLRYEKRHCGKKREETSKSVAVPILNPNAAGIDIGGTLHAIVVPEDRDENNVREFGTMSCNLDEIVEWQGYYGKTYHVNMPSNRSHFYSRRIWRTENWHNAHSLNFQLDYELIHKLNLRLPYRYLDVKTTYDAVLKQRPLMAKDRAFLNANYEIHSKWKLNYTLQWTSTKRLPMSSIYPEKSSPSFFMMNAQLNKSLLTDKLEIYAGVENLTNYLQEPLILLAETPKDPRFDASQVWGPVMGRNLYIGFRYSI